mmetsp:Transcript_116878/g.337737  ORF Transcript_116878/g.337737 Transcript_116878/m.337737 type:complete len:906 (-) Transcript_116878:181-2898(-)
MKVAVSTTGILLGLAASLFTYASAAGILGVDLGSLYMKVALVQRGAPLEIVTNFHSKRKTEQMILFDQGARFYGADASSLLARKPTKTPGSMSVMLGRDDNHPAVKVLTERHFPLTPKFNETRNGLYLMVDGKESYTPEELISMLLSHAEEMTIAYGKEKGNEFTSVRDCVLTVPSFATQAERQAYLDAASLANFNVLGLIEENTASALNFGMDKTYEEPKVYLFYNLGGSSLQVSVIKYHVYQVPESKHSKKMKTVGSIEVLGKAWDQTLGGQAFDNRLVDYMADHFNREWRKARGHDKDVRDVPRAMTKIRLQANKVKHVLSANQEIPVHMDALHDDLSLSMHFTRAQLEELCDDLMERAVAPVHDAIKMANLTLDDIDEIEMIGGGMRVPKVQADLSAALGGKELGMHINSDESMALGAAFYGANISTAFRVRTVGLTDINPFPVKVTLKDLEETKPKDGEEAWGKEATIFKAQGKLGVKKTIAFTHDSDVHCALDYAEPETLPEGATTELQRYKISGVAEFAKEMEEKGLGKPKVSLQFELSQSGLTELVKAEAAVEETYTVEEEVEVEEEESESEKKEEDAEAGNTERKTEETAEGEETKTEDSAEVDEKKEEKKEKKTKIVEKEKKRTHKKTLVVSKYYVSKVTPLSEEIFEESKAKIEELNRKDRERIELEAAKNKVESYCYLIKNRLMDEEEKVNKVSTEEQREEISKLAADTTDWLDFDAYDADLETMQAKYKALSEPAEKIWFRMKELTARPEAIAALNDKITKAEDILKKWESSMPHITEEERGDVQTKIDDVKKWIQEKVEAQDGTADHEDPVFSSAEVPEQSKSFERLIGKLSKKPKPKPEKKEEEKKNDNETKAEGEDASDEKSDDSNAEEGGKSEEKADDAKTTESEDEL